MNKCFMTLFLRNYLPFVGLNFKNTFYYTHLYSNALYFTFFLLIFSLLILCPFPEKVLQTSHWEVWGSSKSKKGRHYQTSHGRLNGGFVSFVWKYFPELFSVVSDSRVSSKSAKKRSSALWSFESTWPSTATDHQHAPWNTSTLYTD